MSSLPPFIELHVVGGGLIYANKAHIVNVYRGGNRCYIKLAFSDCLVEITETYEQLKTMLRD